MKTTEQKQRAADLDAAYKNGVECGKANKGAPHEFIQRLAGDPALKRRWDKGYRDATAYNPTK